MFTVFRPSFLFIVIAETAGALWAIKPTHTMFAPDAILFLDHFSLPSLHFDAIFFLDPSLSFSPSLPCTLTLYFSSISPCPSLHPFLALWRHTFSLIPPCPSILYLPSLHLDAIPFPWSILVFLSLHSLLFDAILFLNSSLSFSHSLHCTFTLLLLEPLCLHLPPSLPLSHSFPRHSPSLPIVSLISITDTLPWLKFTSTSLINMHSCTRAHAHASLGVAS